MQRSGSAHVYYYDNYKEETGNLKQGRKSMMINLDILRVADTAPALQ